MMHVQKGVDPTVQTILWSRIEDNGLEYCEVDTQPVTRLSGHVVTQLDGKPMAVSYIVECDNTGATKSMELSCRIDGIERNLSLHRSLEDRWFCDGKELTEFFGLKDVDLGITPSTNSLAIRRLNLSPGESKELTAVWLRFPDLSLAPLAQRYTCIDSTTYLYESIKSGYHATITVDINGVVTVYQGEWKRVDVFG